MKRSKHLQLVITVPRFDQLNAELFYPVMHEKMATDEAVCKILVEAAQCLLKELQNPKKATSDYLSSNEGNFSFAETSEKDHLASFGEMTTMMKLKPLLPHSLINS